MKRNNRQSYPEPSPERRLRNRSRPDYSERRKDQRYLADFPARIFVGEGDSAREYVARVRNISSGGLLVEAPDVPREETRIRVRFRVPEGVMPEEYVQGTVTAEAECVNTLGGDRLGLMFTENLATRHQRTSWTYMRWLAALVLIGAASLVLLVKYENLYYFWFDVPIFLYSLLVGGYLLSRFLFASFYGNSQPLPESPSLSVIIPVCNEEEHIERTVRQLMESAYPRDRLQVIAVNDASTDRSMEVLQEVRKTYPELVVVDMDGERGKRHALATGVALSTGEVLVFIDSDSFLDPDALRNLTNRFRDPRVAAVTGHCDVENVWSNMLTRMQSVRYFIAFRVMKAAESIFGAVTCLSGPLTAYRRGPLMEVMDDWLNQTFLGHPATFGDDRSLTNNLLRRGYIVQYEYKARTTTIVPDKHLKFLRQQMRWKRSWFRESTIAFGFMWRQQPLMALSFYLGFLLPLISPVILALVHR